MVVFTLPTPTHARVVNAMQSFTFYAVRFGLALESENYILRCGSCAEIHYSVCEIEFSECQVCVWNIE